MTERFDTAEARLRQIPWDALEGLAPALDGPIAEVLAGAAAERVLDRVLRAHRRLDARGRAAVAEAIFGVGLWRRRLAAQLRLPGAGPRLLLASLLRDLGGVSSADAERLAGVAPGALPPPRPAPEALADRHSLPDWLADVLVREAGAEAAALADALNRPAPICLRPNPLRGDPSALAARLEAEGVPTRPGRFAPGARVVTIPRPNLFGTACWREGAFEVQDEASQLVAALVGAAPGEAVLDLCAGAGGKTLALAGAVAPGGKVHAADPDAEALARLRVRAQRAGASGLVEIHGDAPPAALRVDVALVDAPCSALGPLRRGPDLRWRLDPSSFDALPELQLALLERAAAHVLPGGRLVYATCTFRREENEDVLLRFERAHPAFRRVTPPVDPALLTEDKFVRTWPHRGGLDGFFLGVYERMQGCAPPH